MLSTPILGTQIAGLVSRYLERGFGMQVSGQDSYSVKRYYIGMNLELYLYVWRLHYARCGPLAASVG